MAMKRTVALGALFASAGVFASPFPQQTTPASDQQSQISSATVVASSKTTTLSKGETITWETVATELVTATMSGQTTTFSHTQEAVISTATDGGRMLYLDYGLASAFSNLVYNKTACSDAPDRSGSMTSQSASATPPPSPLTNSLSSPTMSPSPPTMSPSPARSQSPPSSPATSEASTLTVMPTASVMSPTAGNGTDFTCPVNGQLVCNGPNQFGLCNWGKVVFQSVADGTACKDGKIVGVGIYSTNAQKRDTGIFARMPLDMGGLSKRADAVGPVFDRPNPGNCFKSDMQAILGGMKPGGIYNGFVGITAGKPNDALKVIPAGNTNVTSFVTEWEQKAAADPDLSWIDRDQLKESVDRAAVFLLWAENFYDDFEQQYGSIDQAVASASGSADAPGPSTTPMNMTTSAS